MQLTIRCRVLTVVMGSALAVLLAVSGAQQDKSPDPHATGKIVVPVGASEVTYCTGCHQTGCPVAHPELVKLTWQAAGRTVLGTSGEVTCGTCHARGFKHRSDAFLARDQKGLCNGCHNGVHSISNMHSSTKDCESCHIKPQVQLAHLSPVETKAMRSDINADCIKCHYDGPITHPINVPNNKKKAPDLPLSPNGNITCVTCHVGHRQQDKFGNMLRKDNRRGGLCNSCHDDL